jgi:hypothetical protein
MPLPKKRTVTVKCYVGELVGVPALNDMRAVVTAIQIGRFNGPQYEIEYFSSGERKCALLFAHEFEITSAD